MHGVDIDFVNLRSETYAEGSRIPEMQFGTPQEARSAHIHRVPVRPAGITKHTA